MTLPWVRCTVLGVRYRRRHRAARRAQSLLVSSLPAAAGGLEVGGPKYRRHHSPHRRNHRSRSQDCCNQHCCNQHCWLRRHPVGSSPIPRTSWWSSSSRILIGCSVNRSSEAQWRLYTVGCVSVRFRGQRHDSAFEHEATDVSPIAVAGSRKFVTHLPLTRTVVDGSTSFAWAKVGSSCPESPASSRAACAERCAERIDCPFATAA